jgi:hypothetical protein
MTEASAVRIGQWGLSNQPSHHIPYMYDFTGVPSHGQAIIREAEAREFTGSEIGQGYPGDEDNGEMSAWQVLSALGIYPLQMGSANWAVGSPLYTQATIHLENGSDVVINAPDNGTHDVYVQSLRIDGKPYHSTSIPTSTLTAGATLDFAMGSTPSDWGSGAADAPPSLTPGGQAPSPLMDATAPTGALFDNTSGTRQTFASQAETIPEPLNTAQPRRVQLYTITSGDVAGDPRDWTLQGSDNGTSWTDLDTRANQTFPWRLQTRPFSVAHPGDYRFYRLNVTANSGEPTTTIAELELLAPAPGSPDQAQTGTVGVGGTVPATLSLTLGGPATFGAFTPGVDRTYDASTTATVTSTAGNAALSVAGPDHLSNGPYTLNDPLQVDMSPASWSAPVSNDPVAIAFHQHIGANDPLRTGTYGTTLTFTLSTTMP